MRKEERETGHSFIKDKELSGRRIRGECRAEARDIDARDTRRRWDECRT
jgi:hypothetical protein